MPEHAFQFSPQKHSFCPGSFVFLPHIAGKDLYDQVAAAERLVSRGYQPVAHLSARNFQSLEEFEAHLTNLERAKVKCCLAIGGVPSVTPKAVLKNTNEMLASPAFRNSSFERVFIAGHPEGIYGMGASSLDAILKDKIALLREQGRQAEIVTQFAFDGVLMAEWATRLRAGGVEVPIRFGVAGVTSLTKLVKFALMCGVGPSLSILKRQMGSVFKVMADHDPSEVLNPLFSGLRNSSVHDVHVHFFPFGGWEKTAAWIASNKQR